MEKDTFRWCGYDWSCKMEGGRIIHTSYPHAWYSDSDNVIARFRNGEMHLYYKENPKEIKHWDGKIYHPTIERAIIRTKQHFSFGHFEIEAKMPVGLNLCSAFWLSGAGNWPPEIDIFESWSSDTNYFHKRTRWFPWFYNNWDTTTNVHYNDKKIKHKHLGSKPIPCKKQKLDPTQEWIKYECDWLPDSIVFYVNGKVTRKVGKKYANWLINNLKDPEKGYLMDAIIDINIDDPMVVKSNLETPLKVRKFKYTPIE